MNTRPSRCAAGRTSHCSERGSTLVEAIIAVAILGIVGAGVLASVATLISSGDRARRAVSSTAAAQSAGEAVAASTTAYVPCADVTSYQPAVNALVGTAIPAGVTVTVASVRYFDGTQFQTTCPSTLAGDARRSQEITLTALSDRSSRTLAVIKREP